MIKEIVNSFERENKILISEEIKGEVYSMFREDESDKEKVDFFIIECYKKKVEDFINFKYFLLKTYITQSIIIYLLVSLFWVCIYYFGILNSYFSSSSEFFKYLLVWSPWAFVGIVITFISMPNKEITINKVKDSNILRYKLWNYLIFCIGIIVLNFIIMNGAPWSIFPITGASGYFSFELAKTKYYKHV